MKRRPSLYRRASLRRRAEARRQIAAGFSLGFLGVFLCAFVVAAPLAFQCGLSKSDCVLSKSFSHSQVTR